MAELSEDDLKFLISADVDDEHLQKAIKQIQDEVERADVAKIKFDLEEAMRVMREGIKEVLPVSFWEEKFGNAGMALEAEFQKAGETLKDLQIGMDPDVLRERIANEQKVADARKQLQAAEHNERIRQGIIQPSEVQFEDEGGDTNQLLAGLLGGQGGGGMLGQLGGMAGEALGGPAGAMVGEALAKAIPGTIAAPAKAATSAMAEVAKGLQGMQGALGPVGVGLDLATDAFAAIGSSVKNIPVVGEVLGPLMDTVGKLPEIFKSVLETATSLVGKVSPGVMKQFNIALEDAQATIGQAFLPVIQEMIPYIRELGTIIAQALPGDDEMRAMFGEVFDSIRDLVQELAPMIGPVLKALTVGVDIFIKTLSGLVEAFKFLAGGVSMVIKLLTFGMVDLEAMLQTSGGEGRKGATAARQANLGGIEEYQRRLQLETFQGGRDTGMQSLPQHVSGIRTVLDNINELFGKLMEPTFLINAVAQGVVGLLPNNPAKDLVNEMERSANMEAGVRQAKAQGKLQHLNPDKGWSTWDLFK